MKRVSVQCRDLRLAYGPTEVLKGVSLDIAPGEFFALLGPSGSGKSSLLRAIAGFARHQGGQLLIDGRDIGALEPWQRQVGMVFQNYALWPHLSVRDNVAFGLVERRVAPAEVRRRVDEALALVDLAAYGERMPSQLSGGQQQRVALARTLVIEPQVLLLDEPLSNLDKSLRVQMRQELLAMQRRLGLTTIFVTHDQEEAMTTADRMAVLDQGVLQQVGTPMQLYDEPVNSFVAGFVGKMNLLPVTVVEVNAAGTTVASAGAEGAQEGPAAAAAEPISLTLHLPGASGLRAGAAAQLGFRPHTMRLQPLDAARDAQCAWLQGVLEASEFLGEFTRYRVRAGGGQAGAMQAGLKLWADQPHRAGQPRLPDGASVAIGLDPAQARLLAG
ncbi:MAG: ABC transporter ATP-binding protein [Betaproteobacteria bacterium]|jgi:iron(III) transport system ATP-binding protein